MKMNNSALQSKPSGKKSAFEATTALSTSDVPVTVLDGTDLIEQSIRLEAIRERSGGNAFSEENIETLAESIYSYTLAQPILVHQTEEGSGEYWITAGHRRYKAYCLLHERYPDDSRFDAIPARVYIITDDLSKRGTVTEDRSAMYITLQDEDALYQDSNLQSRQLTYSDALHFIDSIITRLHASAEYRRRVSEAKAKSSRGVNEAAFLAEMIAEQHYAGWSLATCKKYLRICNICDEAKAKMKTGRSIEDLPRIMQDCLSLYDRIHLPENDPNRISVRSAYEQLTTAYKPSKTSVRSVVAPASKLLNECRTGGRRLTLDEKNELRDLRDALNALLEK